MKSDVDVGEGGEGNSRKLKPGEYRRRKRKVAREEREKGGMGGNGGARGGARRIRGSGLCKVRRGEETSGFSIMRFI